MGDFVGTGLMVGATVDVGPEVLGAIVGKSVGDAVTVGLLDTEGAEDGFSDGERVGTLVLTRFSISFKHLILIITLNSLFDLNRCLLVKPSKLHRCLMALGMQPSLNLRQLHFAPSKIRL